MGSSSISARGSAADIGALTGGRAGRGDAGVNAGVTSNFVEQSYPIFNTTVLDQSIPAMATLQAAVHSSNVPGGNGGSEYEYIRLKSEIDRAVTGDPAILYSLLFKMLSSNSTSKTTTLIRIFPLAAWKRLEHIIGQLFNVTTINMLSHNAKTQFITIINTCHSPPTYFYTTIYRSLIMDLKRLDLSIRSNISLGLSLLNFFLRHVRHLVSPGFEGMYCESIITFFKFFFINYTIQKTQYELTIPNKDVMNFINLAVIPNLNHCFSLKSDFLRLVFNCNSIKGIDTFWRDLTEKPAKMRLPDNIIDLLYSSLAPDKYLITLVDSYNGAKLIWILQNAKEDQTRFYVQLYLERFVENSSVYLIPEVVRWLIVFNGIVGITEENKTLFLYFLLLIIKDKLNLDTQLLNEIYQALFFNVFFCINDQRTMWLVRPPFSLLYAFATKPITVNLFGEIVNSMYQFILSNNSAAQIRIRLNLITSVFNANVNSHVYICYNNENIKTLPNLVKEQFLNMFMLFATRKEKITHEDMDHMVESIKYDALPNHISDVNTISKKVESTNEVRMSDYSPETLEKDVKSKVKSKVISNTTKTKLESENGTDEGNKSLIRSSTTGRPTSGTDKKRKLEEDKKDEEEHIIIYDSDEPLSKKLNANVKPKSSNSSPSKKVIIDYEKCLLPFNKELESSITFLNINDLKIKSIDYNKYKTFMIERFEEGLEFYSKIIKWISLSSSNERTDRALKSAEHFSELIKSVILFYINDLDNKDLLLNDEQLNNEKLDNVFFNLLSQVSLIMKSQKNPDFIIEFIVKICNRENKSKLPALLLVWIIKNDIRRISLYKSVKYQPFKSLLEAYDFDFKFLSQDPNLFFSLVPNLYSKLDSKLIKSNSNILLYTLSSLDTVRLYGLKNSLIRGDLSLFEDSFILSISNTLTWSYFEQNSFWDLYIIHMNKYLENNNKNNLESLIIQLFLSKETSTTRPFLLSQQQSTNVSNCQFLWLLSSLSPIATMKLPVIVSLIESPSDELLSLMFNDICSGIININDNVGTINSKAFFNYKGLLNKIVIDKENEEFNIYKDLNINKIGEELFGKVQTSTGLNEFKPKIPIDWSISILRWIKNQAIKKKLLLWFNKTIKQFELNLTNVTLQLTKSSKSLNNKTLFHLNILKIQLNQNLYNLKEWKSLIEKN